MQSEKCEQCGHVHLFPKVCARDTGKGYRCSCEAEPPKGAARHEAAAQRVQGNVGKHSHGVQVAAIRELKK